jgi:acetyltransferase-like isoleucine patch superfamily enzyme
VFISQGCFFLDYGGISIGDRVLIGPRMTLSTVGHPVELDERYDFITHPPIVIEDDVWVGAGATITPGVTIGRGSVVGAGAVVAKDVPATRVVERRRLRPA